MRNFIQKLILDKNLTKIFPMFVTEIEVESFKSIGQPVKLELRPLTILIGPNKAGKSSILQALSLYHTWRLTGGGKLKPEIYGKGITEFEIGYVKRFHNVLTGNPSKLKFSAVVNRYILDAMREYLKLHGEVADFYLSDLRRLLECLERLLESELYSSKYGIKLSEDVFVEYTLETKLDGTPTGTFGLRLYRRTRLNCVWYSGFVLAIEDGRVIEPLKHFGEYCDRVGEIYYTMASAHSCYSSSIFMFPRFIYISSLREYIPDAKNALYTLRDVRYYVGPCGENVFDIIVYMWEARGRIRSYETLLDELLRLMRTIGVQYVGGGLTPEKTHELIMQDHDIFVEREILLPPSCFSYGTRQLLPIITQFIISKPGDVILIEEPEISLHAEHQVKLTELLAYAVSKGIQLIISTHSTYFLLALPFYVQRTKELLKERDVNVEKLTAEDLVIVYEVERDNHGFTQVRRIDLTPSGLPKELPSFSKVEKRLWETLLMRSEIFQ